MATQPKNTRQKKVPYYLLLAVYFILKNKRFHEWSDDPPKIIDPILGHDTHFENQGSWF